MSRNEPRVFRTRTARRRAAVVGVAVLALLVLTSAVVWSQSSVSCAAPGWPAELFCFSPLTPAKSNEINANFRTLSIQGPPAGSIISYAGNSEPEGWLMCSGQSVSTATYPRLFAAIGYRYGGSGGSFNLPNLQSRYMMGAASMSSDLTSTVVGSNTANHSHTITANHTHTEGNLGAHVAWSWDGLYWHIIKNDADNASMPNFTASFATGAVAPWGWGDTGSYDKTKISGTTAGAHSSGTTTTNINNRPASYSMKYIIRY